MHPAILALTLGAAALPQVEELDAAALRPHVRQLLAALPADLLPPVTRQELLRLLAKPRPDPARVQELLDAHCLVAVSINPESRVKAARGPAAAVLVRDQAVAVLVKVHNEAGVTHPLVVTGPQLRGPPGPGRWLDAAVAAGPPLPRSLTGQPLQYVVLHLTAREAGKREATLCFDVGQGTQDLGFRAEVPILFTVR
jgi:hypothetical protein